MQLASRIYGTDGFAEAQELFHSNGWTDGLPVVPPTPGAVAACLEWAMVPPDQLIGVEPVRGVAITAEKLAINAVIGRAIRLALINLLEVRPGGIDRSTLGHPGKFSYCIAEDEEDTSWLPLSVQRGMPEGASAVTVMAAALDGQTPYDPASTQDR